MAAGDQAADNPEEWGNQLSVLGAEYQAFEIAQILEMDAGSVRKQLHRMRQKTPALVEQRGNKWILASGPIGQREAAPEEEPDTDTPF